MESKVLKQDDSEVTITIHEKDGYADISFRGAITRRLLDNTFLSLIDSPGFQFNLNAVYDYCNAYSELEMSEIQEHAQFVGSHLGQRGNAYKLALVANDTLNYALLEVYKLLVSKTSVEVEVFSDHTKAVQWICQSER